MADPTERERAIVTDVMEALQGQQGWYLRDTTQPETDAPGYHYNRGVKACADAVVKAVGKYGFNFRRVDCDGE